MFCFVIEVDEVSLCFGFQPPNKQDVEMFVISQGFAPLKMPLTAAAPCSLELHYCFSLRYVMSQSNVIAAILARD